MKTVKINPDYLNAEIERKAFHLDGSEMEDLKPFARYASLEDAKLSKQIPFLVEVEE